MSRTSPIARAGAMLGAVALLAAGVPAAQAVEGSVPTGAVAASVVKLDIAGDPEAAPGAVREPSCSGVLVSAAWVVTAASCFVETPGVAVAAGAPAWATEATVGRADLASSAGAVVAVDRLVPHPRRDVVLAHLAAPVPSVTPVKVGASAPAVGEKLTVVGFGRTADRILPSTVHAASYTVGAVSTATLDIAADGSGAGICKGDAGGPALRTTSGGAVELVAIHHTAFQGGCLGATSTKQDAVETRVDDLGPWILRSTRNAQGADLDGNGKADVFWSSMNDGRWRVSYGGTTPWNVINYAGAFPTDWFQFGDFDGDGRDDVFLAPGDGRWLVSNGGTSGWRVLNHGPGDHLAFVDLAGDGRTDVFRVDPATGAWYVSDDGTQPFRQINGAPGFGTASLRFGEFNGDFKDDVFRVDPATGLWYISDGGTQPLRQVNGAPGIGGEAYQLADLTGDGKADVFLANSDGRWLVSDGGTQGWSSNNGDANVLPGRPKVR